MSKTSFLKDKRILVVDDEWDVLESIHDHLSSACIDITSDRDNALEYISNNRYDFAILDIMNGHGIELLEECVKKDIPAIILITATAPRELLMEAVKKGAVSYLAKKHLDELKTLIYQLFASQDQGNPEWKLMFKKLQEISNGDFWTGSEKKWDISKGIQERLLHSKDIVDKGI